MSIDCITNSIQIIDKRIIVWLENNADATWMVTHLLHAHTSAYYGKITVQFEAGNIILLRKEQTQKPPHKSLESEND